MWAGVAKFVAILGLSDSSRPARDQSAPSTGLHGRAESTGPKSKPDGPRISEADLMARAMRLHNRDTRAAQRYVERHMSLIRGR